MFFPIAGILLLWAGAESLVRGSAALASRLRIRPLVIGLTVVAMGTSAPEFTVSLRAAMIGSGDVCLGNVVGSNICNVGLILGLSALIRPLRVRMQTVRYDVPILIAASSLLFFFLLDSTLTRREGAILCGAFLGFLLFMLVSMRREEGGPAEQESIQSSLPDREPWLASILVLVGLLMLVAGGDLFVRSSLALARRWQVSEAFLGLTLVALGTSLPELAASTVASWRGQSDIAVGNVVGSNLFNILFILGVSPLVRPVRGPNISTWDMVFMIGYAVLLAPLTRSGFTLTRREGAGLMILYFLYLILVGTR